MTSQTHRIPPREEQFIRFVDTVRKIGKEKAIGELDKLLVRMVPPVRAGIAEARHGEGSLLHRSSDPGLGSAPDPL